MILQQIIITIIVLECQPNVTFCQPNMTLCQPNVTFCQLNIYKISKFIEIK